MFHTPLSHPQKRIWLSEILHPDTNSFNLSFTFKFDYPIIFSLLEKAINLVITANEGFRISIREVNGNPGQNINRHKQYTIPFLDFTNRDQDEKNWIENETRTSIPVTDSKLYRIYMIRYSDSRDGFLLNIHHIISDGWTIGLLGDQIKEIYEKLSKKEEILQQERPSYIEYVKSEIEYLNSKRFKENRIFWKEYFKDLPDTLKATCNYSKNGVSEASRFVQYLSSDFTNKINSFCRDNKISPFILYFTVIGIYFHRITEQERFIIGTATHNRTGNSEKKTAGMFVNILPVLHDFSYQHSFLETIQLVSRNFISLFRNQKYPFDILMEDIRNDHNFYQDLFEVVFSYENKPISLNNYWNFNGVESYPLVIHLVEREGSDHPKWEIDYKTDLFHHEEIKSLYASIICLLNDGIKYPDRKIEELNIIDSYEEKKQLNFFSKTEKRCNGQVSVSQLFSLQVNQTPDTPAILHNGKVISYKELNTRSNQYAGILKEKGIQKGDVIAVMLNRTPELIAGIIAIVKAGGIYLPIDPSYPDSRFQYMIEESSAKLIITQNCYLSKVNSIRGKCIFIEDIDLHKINRDGNSNSDPENPLYIIFTSGSTGKPKGTLIGQEGLINLIRYHKDVFGQTTGTRMSQVAGISFDAMAFELWTCLLNGATLCLVDDSVRISPSELKKWLLDNEIEITFQSTAICDQLLNLEWPDRCSLRVLQTAGDYLKHVPKRKFPFKLYNLYGPTEATIWSSMLEIVNPEKYNVKPNIGAPIANTRIYILDSSQRLLPLGVPGEICIGGAGVARGYLNRPELTAEKFIPDPFRPGERIYRTGDLARWLPDGNLEFLGRIDQQVKIRGYRIEPGEIESTLAGVAGVRETVVEAVEEKTGKSLCAYVVSSGEVTRDDLEKHLAAELPDYMVPSCFVFLDALPLTANGKVDRKALPKPQANSSPGETCLAPVSDREKLLVRVWEEILGQSPIGIKDNFFYRGGDSIKAIQMASELQKNGYTLPIPALYDYPIIQELQDSLTPLTETASDKPVTGPAPLTPIQKWFFEQNFPSPHHWNQKVTIDSPAGDDPGVLHQSLKELVLHHDALRTVFPDDRIPFVRGEEEPFYYFALLPEERHKEIHNRLDLNNGPLLAAAMDNTVSPARVSIVIHHLVVDGISWRILLEDLHTLCSSLLKSKEPILPPKTAPFNQWAPALEEYASSHLFLRELPYWEKLEKAPLPALREDRPAGPCTRGEIAQWEINLDISKTASLLNDCHHAYNTEINDLLLCALSRAFTQWNNGTPLYLNLEGHGREDPGDGRDTSRSVGWFTSSYPVLLEGEKGADLSRQIPAIKETLRKIPRKGIGYGIIRYLTNQEKSGFPHLNKTPEVSFNYLGVFNELTGVELSMAPDCPFPYALDINGLVESGSLRLIFAYNSRRFNEVTIRELAEQYKTRLYEIIRHCRKRKVTCRTPWDYGDSSLTEQEMERLPHEAVRVCPLTPLQEGMLLAHMRNPSTGTYFEQLGFTLSGSFDQNLFESRWQGLLDRHEILRTIFLYEGMRHPRQVVLEKTDNPVEYRDISHLTGSEKREYINRYREEDRNTPFTLTERPPCRLRVLREEDSKHRIFFSFHHILLDGWCLGIFLKEMFSGDSSPIRGDYYKFLQWRDERDHEASSLYWKEYLEDWEARTALPGRKEGHSGCSQKEKLFILPEGETAGLTGWAREKGVTTAAVFQAAWGLLLQRYNSTDDAVFGFVDSGRPPEVADADRMMGLFINTVPVRVRSRPGMTFADLTRQVQEGYSRSREHSYYPLAEIQSDTGLKDGLINHIAAFENYPLPAELKEMISDVEVFEQADYDFNLLILPGDRLEVRIRYNEEAFAEDKVEECGRRILSLLKSIPGQGDVLLDRMELLSREEQEKLIAFSAGPVSPYPSKTIHQVFRERAGEMAGQTALVYGEQKMSYGMLDCKTDALAAFLTGQEISPGSVIAVMSYRSFEMVIAILGIMKAGCTYLPIDPDMPEERMGYILRDSGAGHMIVPAEKDKCAAFSGKVHSLENLPTAGNRGSGAARDISPDNPAYIIYTSGSTGKPKGVVVEHRNAVNTLFALQEAYPLNEGDAFLLKTPYSFDVSVAELFGWFFGRGRLVILNPGEEKEPGKMLRIIGRHRVTHINFVPSMLDLFLEGLEEKDLPSLENLRYIFSAGEALTSGIARKFHSLTNKVRLENLYGPTEAAVYATGVSIKPGDEDCITIGRPLTNTSAFILDANNRPVPPGLPGELCLSGAGITRGYLNRRNLTEERFVPSPFAKGEKMYRTGDLTRWTPSGNIEYLGRMDNQVKIRGNRVELGEIETCLAAHEDIDKALVIDRDDTHRLKYLAAYYISSGDPAPGDLRKYIAKLLPSYMVPAYFMKVDSFPLSGNGKLDRKNLPEPVDIILTGEEYVAPRNEREEEIDEIWQDVLGIERIGVHDNFFDLGGDSIKAIQVFSRLTEKYDIAMTDIFEYETIASLSTHIHNRQSDFKKRIEKIRTRAAEDNSRVDLTSIMGEMERYTRKNSRYLMMDLSSRVKYRHILLTGATGYLGCHILRDLLEETDAAIHPLVRGVSADEAENRLRRQLEFYFDRDLFNDFPDRIVLRTGDLGADRLGITEEDYAGLSTEIDCIINCAANVRHYGHYDDFEQINVRGVERLIDLALAGRKKDVNHISTMSVGMAGMRGREYFLFHEYKTDLDPGFDNVYIKSKLEAERLVLEARNKGLRTNIFRAGNLVFNRETGKFQKNIHENAFYTSVKSYIKLGSYPKIKHRTLDFSYVDYSSKAVVLLFDRKELENEIHHIINPHTISINKMGTLITEAGYPLEVRDFSSFLDFMYANHSNRAVKEHILNILLHSHIIENPDTIGLVQLNTKTVQILHRMDFCWPVPDRELMEKMLKYCRDVEFI